MAGGRDFRGSYTHQEWLVNKFIELGAEEIVSGFATGADQFGEEVADQCMIPVKQFLPDWKRYGRSAGPRRNKDMAEYVGASGACILFPGGVGTKSMKQEAEKMGMTIIEWNEGERK